MDYQNELSELRTMLNQLPMHRGQRKLEDSAKSLLQEFVSTREEYEKKLKETIDQLRAEDETKRNEAQIKVQNQWKKIQDMVSEDEGVSNSKKLDLAWCIAWDSGHSGGYEEVVNQFRNICVLLKD